MSGGVLDYLCTMKKIALNFLLIAFALFFTGASGGFFYMLHHCHAHHVSNVIFTKAQEGDCCTHEGTCCSGEAEASHACCSMHTPVPAPGPEVNGSACCSDEAFFVKIFYQYVGSERAPVKVLSTDLIFEPGPASLWSGRAYAFSSLFFKWPPGGLVTPDLPVILANLRV